MFDCVPVKLSLFSGLILFAAAINTAEACFWPAKVPIVRRGERAVFAAPLGLFQAEVYRILSATDPEYPCVLGDNLDRWGYGDVDQTACRKEQDELDAADVRAALASEGRSASDIVRLVDAYRDLRARLSEFAVRVTRWKQHEGGPYPWRIGTEVLHPVLADFPPVPEGLPGEFDDYLRGAIAYYREQREEAREHWMRLLNRPRSERRYRSTWAAFMLGKSLLESGSEECVTWFRHVRELAAAGFADSAGLAAASLGREAQMDLRMGRLREAMEIYARQCAGGEPGAVFSLRFAAIAALHGTTDELIAVAAGPIPRRVVTAYLVSYGGYVGMEQWTMPAAPRDDLRRWLEAVEIAGITDVGDADRLAWAAYEAGAWKIARRWAARAPKDATMARWIDAKLDLREGNLPDAASKLADAAHDPETWDPVTAADRPFPSRPAEDYALIRLTQQRYTDALDAFLRAGCWQDAAYVAEQVLSLNELRAWIEGASDALAPSARSEVMHLLARRLMRAGKIHEAAAYFPAECSQQYAHFVDALETARDGRLPAARRAQAWWTAAVMTHDVGLDLVGTELDPDWRVWGGYGGAVRFLQSRRRMVAAHRLSASTDELARGARHTVFPDRDVRLRLIAADDAWRAAQLLPDNTDEKALILYTAGSWIKYVDPERADRFYKALVRHCRKTELGQLADKKRWFPRIEMEYPPDYVPAR